MSWKEFKLDDLIKIKHGYAFKGEYFSDEVTTDILVTPGNFLIGGGFKHNKLKYYKGPILKDYILKKNDVIVTMTDLSKQADTLGFSARVPEIDNCTLLHNQRIGLLQLKEIEFDLDFIYWLMRTEEYQRFVAGSATGSTVKHTSPTKIYAYKFYAPSNINIQKRIASILSAYDDLIENNLKRIKLLEELAQRTYEEWFVKFRINGEQLEVGENGLPDGWERKKIGDVCFVSGGGTPSRAINEYWENGTINWYSPTDLSKSKSLFQITSSDKITNLGLQKSSSKLLESNSFMMTSRATIGLFGIVDIPFCTNQGFINITPRETIHKEYLLYNFKNRIEEFIGNASGTTFLEISKSTFKNLDIIWLDENTFKKYNKLCSNFHNQIKTLTHQNRLLKESRDILLPRLMIGKIDVSIEVLGMVAEESEKFSKG